MLKVICLVQYSKICILSDNVRVYNSVNFVYIYLSKIFYLYCNQTFNNHLHHFHTCMYMENTNLTKIKNI